MDVNVLVGVGVLVGVLVGVFVNVGVLVGVLVAAPIGVFVGVGVGKPTWMINCGLFADVSLLPKLIAVALVVVIAKLTSALPVTSEVTSTSIQPETYG